MCRGRHRWARWVCGLVVVLGVATTAEVRGQASESHATSGYDELIASAVEEFERGNWVEAEALFARAHAVEPNARTLRGMGVCAYEAKHYVRALVHLRAALVERNKPLTEAQVEEVTGVIERAEGFVARLELTLQPPSATLLVDSRAPVYDDARRVLLDPGPHELTLSHPGYASALRTVDVRPSETATLTLTLMPLAAASDGDAGDAESPGTRTWAWVAGGAAIAFAGAGAAALLLAHAGVANVEDRCPPGSCSSAQIEAAIDDEHLELLRTGSILGFALAGAAAGTAAVLFIVDASPAERAPSSRLSVRIAPGAVALQGRY